MDGASSGTGAAFSATVSLLTRSATSWVLPIVLLAWVGAIPAAIAEYHARDLLALLTGPDGIGEAAGIGAWLAAVVLLVQFVIQLVALQWAFMVLADVAAGRPINLRAGLRRTITWRLQISWLFSALILDTASSAWWCGGCLLFLPFGFAAVDAYEADSGMAAFGRSVRLGLTRAGGGIGETSRLAWPIVTVSTLTLAAVALLSCGASCVGSGPFSGGLSESELLAQLGSLDLSRPDQALIAILRALAPEPDLTSAVTTILLAPADSFVQVLLMGVQLVVYNDALRVTREAESPATA